MTGPRKAKDAAAGKFTPGQPGSSAASKPCWCGHTELVSFGPDYAECRACGCLVLQKQFSTSEFLVTDDDQDFYGKTYWLDHQKVDLEFPDIFSRARSDLTERNLHWLQTLLKYRLPSARTIELGCAHGSFVALMKQAGFDASGVEMSPWVVAFGRETFGIDVQTGPVENLNIAPGSIEVIALMDVMEHLPDPKATMSHCLDLLKPDGFLLVQMPEFREGMRFDQLVETNSSFLTQLKSDEHLFLYSKRAAREFFHRLGADHIEFEPAIFAHYDMFFVVSRSALRRYDTAEIEAALQASPGGRIALALLDLKSQRDERPEPQALADQAQALQRLYEDADKIANERNLATAQLADLQRNFDAVELDRVARGEVIESQGEAISALQSQVHDRINELDALYSQIEQTPGSLAAQPAKLQELYELADKHSNDHNLATAQLADLQRNFDAVELDRVARGEVIQTQGEDIVALQAQIHARLNELQELYELADTVANERNLAAAQLADLQRNFDAVELDRIARGEVIQKQGEEAAALHAQVHARIAELDALYPQLEQSQQALATQAAKLQELYELADKFSNERNLAIAQLADLQRNFDAVEQDRIARGEVIQVQGVVMADLHAQMHGRLQELNAIYSELEELRRGCATRDEQLRTLRGQLVDAERDGAASAARVAEQVREISELEAQKQQNLAKLKMLGEQMDEANAELAALRQRWWWKLGKKIKAL